MAHKFTAHVSLLPQTNHLLGMVHTTTSDIFLSYSRKDLNYARTIKKELERQTGLNYWMDLDGIESASQFEEKIIKAIDNVSIVIFLMSGNSMRSDYAKKELRYAACIGKRVVPVNIDHSEPTGWFLFNYSGINIIDYNNIDQRNNLIRDLKLWCPRQRVTATVANRLGSEYSGSNVKETIKKRWARISFFIGLAVALLLLLVLAFRPVSQENQEQAENASNIEPGNQDGNADAEMNDDPRAGFILGMRYQTGNCVEQDVERAFAIYRESAEKGEPFAQYQLAECYYRGVSVDNDEQKAKEWYKKAYDGLRKKAIQGDAQAMSYLGQCYELGQGVEADAQEALKWYRMASDQGDPFGQYHLGDVYENGKGVEDDLEQAKKWYRLSAEQGNAQGQGALGSLLFFTEANDEGLTWLKKAAEQGDAGARCSLYTLYTNDMFGVPQDPLEASILLYKAALQGDAFAQYARGNIHEEGEGSFDQDYAEAARWYRKAAMQGYGDAQYQLGKLYESGNGVPKDYTQAEKWIRKAEEQGVHYY